MKGYVFPGQGSQFTGMGKDLYESSIEAKSMFDKANKILGFSITDIMFNGDLEELKQTKITQPAIFLHSVILSKLLAGNFKADMVAGHSLGEFSALVAAGYLSFEDGLNLVSIRASAMQDACERQPSTMAAVLGIENKIVEKICEEVNEIVVPANYNCPGQVVISGSVQGVDIACEKLTEAGARRVLKLSVGGAFHSPLMEPARKALKSVIDNTEFRFGICPIYQNVNSKATTNPIVIKENLNKQLISSVLWTQTMESMIKDGLTSVIEVGPGKVLQGLFKKVDRGIISESASLQSII